MRERLTLTTRDQQRLEVLTRWIGGLLTVDEAGGLLGLSERSAWRLRRRLLKEGADGLVHGNRGRPSPRQIDTSTHARIIELVGPGGRYRGGNDCHLAEADGDSTALGETTATFVAPVADAAAEGEPVGDG